jgi:hypothetical protein
LLSPLRLLLLLFVLGPEAGLIDRGGVHEHLQQGWQHVGSSSITGASSPNKSPGGKSTSSGGTYSI